jgi:hypothetical protein
VLCFLRGVSQGFKIAMISLDAGRIGIAALEVSHHDWTHAIGHPASALQCSRAMKGDHSAACVVVGVSIAEALARVYVSAVWVGGPAGGGKVLQGSQGLWVAHLQALRHPAQAFADVHRPR